MEWPAGQYNKAHAHGGGAVAQPVQSVVAVRSERVAGGAWSVVVAAQLRLPSTNSGNRKQVTSFTRS